LPGRAPASRFPGLIASVTDAVASVAGEHSRAGITVELAATSAGRTASAASWPDSKDADTLEVTGLTGQEISTIAWKRHIPRF
jgi:hypothetical protein